MHYLGLASRKANGMLELRIPAFDNLCVDAPTTTMALERAVIALEEAVLSAAARTGSYPTPDALDEGPDHAYTGPIHHDEDAYRLPVSAYAVAKLGFIASFAKSGKTRVQLAEEMGKRETEIRRMLDPTHPTKLPTLEHGLRALGKRLEAKVIDLPPLVDF